MERAKFCSFENFSEEQIALAINCPLTGRSKPTIHLHTVSGLAMLDHCVPLKGE
jgi:hypothetical protein